VSGKALAAGEVSGKALAAGEELVIFSAETRG
jgi:hypothetical protein